MTRLTLIVALLLATLPRAQAAVFTCADSRTDRPECADRELVGLDKAVDARFDAMIARADPLTSLLLQRDQAWFEEIMTRGFTRKFEGADDSMRLRLKDTLARRLATLDTIDPRALAAGPAGTWGNALASVTVREAGTGALQVTFTAKLAYEERDDTLTCAVAGTFKEDGSGWFAGELAPPDAPGTRARLRLQGNTLRIVHADDNDHRVCGKLALITGSYFPMAPAAAGTAAAVAARTVSPTFRCATARNADELEICADPELAARDSEIGRVYGETLRRLEPRLAARLRADQRAWVKDNGTAYDASLHPAAAKATSTLHDTDGAREELRLRLDERLAMLANLDDKRKGIAGLWEAYNAALVIAPAADKTDGTATAEGFKWETGDYKSRCDFKSTGRIAGGTFRAKEAFPTLTRDGAMLILGAEDRDDKPASEAPDYCNRLPSAKARLFPVKPAGNVGGDFGRYR
jgi:uncharacterized protein YecT (DUF1311 family)